MPSNTRSSNSEHHFQDQAPRPRNIKRSCDFCALSKVKCDRGTPECQRCIRNEVKCHYSRSRRVSKILQLYTNTGRNEQSEDHDTSPGQWNQLSRNESNHSNHSNNSNEYEGHAHSRSSSIHADSQPGSLELSSLIDLFGINDRDMTSETEFSCMDESFNGILPTFDSQQNVGRTEPFQGSSQGNLNVASIAPNLSITASNLANSNDTNNNMLFNHPNIDEGHCIRRACNVLESLHSPILRCPKQQDGSMSPIISYGVDDILRTNQIAINDAINILSCPCTNNRGLLSILVLIGRQIMDSYWNLLQQQFTSTPNEYASSTNSTLKCNDGSSDAVHVPIAIGGYVLDKEVGKQVLLAVLQSEMGKIGRFVENLLPRDVPKDAEGLLQSFRACQERLAYCSGMVGTINQIE